jgi:HEAT repeat protein
MKLARETDSRRHLGAVKGAVKFGTVCLVLELAAVAMVCAQQPAEPSPAAAQTAPAANPDSQVVGDTPVPGMPAAEDATPEGRERAAWKLLTDAMADVKHPQVRIQALAALGLLRSVKSETMLRDAMGDPDLDVRTAAILAAGQAKDRNLTTEIRNMLDDKEPQVAFTAATTLWKMGDKSGEDILASVVDGERSANPTMVHGTEHKISRDLHDPAMLARLGALQGAAMVLGPFGFGITAFEYMRQSGGDLSRVSAIEQISQEHTEPVHQELIGALTDKDQTVRAAAAKALADYHDAATSKAVYALLSDPKQPVRLTAAAAYLRTTGTPGPELEKPVPPAATPRKRLTTPSSTKPAVAIH